LKKYKYLGRIVISVGAYENTSQIPMVGVTVFWIVNEATNDKHIKNTSMSLWN
tara:strand:- start:331 stop:489 length:159 start_codon:yes stop_codon:yes gene_type:complete